MILRSLKNSLTGQIALLLVAIFLFVGKPVPFSNEYVYLLRLVKTYQPDFLSGDLSFSATASEHWLFNHLFGVLTLVFPIEIIGWAGRISCWIILLIALFRLASHWRIPNWAVSVSIFLWLAMGQTLVNDEWIFGGFEAKVVAYICLLFALDLFLQEREKLAAVLLGLSFSFHPAVGLWAILAVGLGMIFCRWDLKLIAQVVVTTGVFALVGFLNLFHESNSLAENWKYFVLERVPHHLDPFSWSVRQILLLGMMFWVCLLADWNKFLKVFLASLGVFFLFGFALRFFEQWQLLCLMPMRVFPVLTPLFFFFTFVKLCKEKSFTTNLMALTLVALLILGLFYNPLRRSVLHVSDTVEAWQGKPTDEIKPFVWLRENSPQESVVLAPPWREDFWYHARRGQFVSYKYPPFLTMTEWQNRLEFIFGKNVGAEEREPTYNNLPPEKIDEIARKYKINYLVSKGHYSYPLVFESGNWKIYQLQP